MRLPGGEARRLGREVGRGDEPPSRVRSQSRFTISRRTGSGCRWIRWIATVASNDPSARPLCRDPDEKRDIETDRGGALPRPAESARAQVEPGDGKSLARVEQGIPPGPASGLQNRGDPLSPEQSASRIATDVGSVP